MKAMVALDVNKDGVIVREEFMRLSDHNIIQEAESWGAEL